MKKNLFSIAALAGIILIAGYAIYSLLTIKDDGKENAKNDPSPAGNPAEETSQETGEETGTRINQEKD